MTDNRLTTSFTQLVTSASDCSQPTVEAALRSADAILGKRAGAVWIMDREGNLILPADQVRHRLSARLSSPPDL